MSRRNRDIIRRSRVIQAADRGAGPVIYWMDRDQRLEDNWALLYAEEEASIRGKALHIAFFLEESESERRSKRYDFCLAGLAQLRRQAAARNIGFSLFAGRAEDLLPALATANDCHLLVTDFSPLRARKHQYRRLKNALAVPIVEVDAHNVIPCWILSEKKEYAAYTLRPKVNRLLDDFLTEFPQSDEHALIEPTCLETQGLPLHTADLDRDAASRVAGFAPGAKGARSTMDGFLRSGLKGYSGNRNDPNAAGQSNLSPHLHAGQLAPQRLALEICKSQAPAEDKESFLEELIVRRELADNFCHYEPDYGNCKGFPSWAQKSHDEHRQDRREFRYSLSQLESGETHQELWNSCQHDLAHGHKLHGYLRMYWAKKILQWTSSPEQALEFANHLNDTYSLDGCDPNGYAGTAWSIGGVHDRAWPEREIFGKIRYMNEKGCRRKFDVEEYIAAVRKRVS